MEKLLAGRRERGKKPVIVRPGPGPAAAAINWKTRGRETSPEPVRGAVPSSAGAPGGAPSCAPALLLPRVAARSCAVLCNASCSWLEPLVGALPFLPQLPLRGGAAGICREPSASIRQLSGPRTLGDTQCHRAGRAHPLLCRQIPVPGACGRSAGCVRGGARPRGARGPEEARGGCWHRRGFAAMPRRKGSRAPSGGQRL